MCWDSRENGRTTITIVPELSVLRNNTFYVNSFRVPSYFNVSLDRQQLTLLGNFIATIHCQSCQRLTPYCSTKVTSISWASISVSLFTLLLKAMLIMSHMMCNVSRVVQFVYIIQNTNVVHLLALIFCKQNTIECVEQTETKQTVMFTISVRFCKRNNDMCLH